MCWRPVSCRFPSYCLSCPWLTDALVMLPLCRRCGVLQMEERAEAAAQRMVMQEDVEIRKAIQDEERKKLEKDTAFLVEKALEEERCVLCACPLTLPPTSVSASRLSCRR